MSTPPVDRTIAAMPLHDRRSKQQRANDDPVARYLGELQAEVMAVFWRHGSATVREVVDELIDRLFSDFGEIAVARLGARLDELDRKRKTKLGAARKRDG